MQLTDAGLPVAFAGVLRRLRGARDLSQRGLAKRAGFTPAYLSLLEAGRRAPERTTVERIAAALDAGAAERDELLHAAGYRADVPPASAGPLSEAEAILTSGPFTSEQRGLMAMLIIGYAQGLAARVRAGKPLVADLAAPWQQRILEAMQEKMAEDFDSFRDSYMRPSFDL